MTKISTHGVTMINGRHKGERITRVPVSYLKWMVNSGHSQADVAEAELARRGTVTPDLEISGHAIDRASLRVRKTWHEDRGAEEGLHAWLVRISGEALSHLDRRLHGENVTVNHKGLKLVFVWDGKWPVLKTIMPAKRTSS